MKRKVIQIDEELCNGCGICVEGCHEGALQLINNKAVMISDIYCDGLGACIGECPVNAISFIEKECEPYDEIAVISRICKKGIDVIKAHLMHLKNHNEIEWYNQGVEWCNNNGYDLGASFSIVNNNSFSMANNTTSQLNQWPVQLHLLNPESNFLKNSDLLLASDCSAFSCADFHNSYFKNKTLAIACPKLDSQIEVYIEKLSIMIDRTKINSISVLMMEVPCCGGLLRIAKAAKEKSKREIPIKAIVISLKGELLKEEWIKV